MTNQQCVFVYDTSEALREALSSHCRHIVEAGTTHIDEVAGSAKQRVISLRSATVLQQPVARALCHDIHCQLPNISVTLLQHMETVLHELLLNAVIHGNWQLNKDFSSAGELADFDQKTQQAAAQPDLANKPVHIHFRYNNTNEIVFRITDIGDGFDHQKALRKIGTPQNDASTLTPYGMGMRFTNELADAFYYEDAGRSACVKFKIQTSERAAAARMDNSSIIENRALYRVVIVDDIEYSRQVVYNILLSNGFTNVACAHSAHEALSLMDKQRPSLIISNFALPNMSGTQLCEMVRTKTELFNVPIILQTSLINIEDRIRAFELGVNDVIEQPIHDKELIARIEMHLSQYIAYQQMQDYRQRLESEIELARQMHISLIPTPEQLSNYRQSHELLISNYFQPSSEIGGDIWGVFEIAEDKLGIYICDFTGHGVEAAINTFRFHTAIQPIEQKADPGEFLNELNRLLYKMLPITQFATFFYGVINTTQETLLYSAAGAPKPFFYNQEAQQCSQIDTSGIPLGIVHNQQYITQSMPFKKGDSMMLYSDALIETANTNGEFLSEEEIHHIVCQHFKNGPKKGQRGTMRSFLNKLGIFDGNRCDDDFTLALISRTE